MSTLLSETLASGAEALDLNLSPVDIARLVRFAELLRHWNRRINLVSRGTDEARLAERHLLDSLALTRLVPEREHVVDIGAGAGFPSLPLHIVQTGGQAGGAGRRATLIEPSAKRCSFLRAAARELGLEGVDVRTSRQEDLRPGEDVAPATHVVSRATFAPADWIGIGARWVGPGAALVVMASREDDATLEAAARANGLQCADRDVFSLPESGARRENLLFRRM